MISIPPLVGGPKSSGFVQRRSQFTSELRSSLASRSAHALAEDDKRPKATHGRRRQVWHVENPRVFSKATGFPRRRQVTAGSQEQGAGSGRHGAHRERSRRYYSRRCFSRQRTLSALAEPAAPVESTCQRAIVTGLRRNFGPHAVFLAEEPLTEEIASRSRWLASHAVGRGSFYRTVAVCIVSISGHPLGEQASRKRKTSNRCLTDEEVLPRRHGARGE